MYDEPKLMFYCCNVGLHFYDWFIVLQFCTEFIVICDININTNERVIWINNSGEVLFVFHFSIFIDSLSLCWCRAVVSIYRRKRDNLKSICIFSYEKTRWDLLILRDFYDNCKWKRAYWWLKIAYCYFIIDVFCIEWNQKLRLNILDNTHTHIHCDQLFTTNVFELLVRLICDRKHRFGSSHRG